MELDNRNERDDEAVGLLLGVLAIYHDELLDIAGDPPSADDVPGEFWLEFQQRVADVLSGILATTFVESAMQHGADSRQQAAEESIGWSVVTALQLALGITATTRRAFNRGEDPEDLFGEDRAEGLAVDAVTRGQTRGGEWAVGRHDGLSPEDEWVALLDEKTCPICSPLHGTRRSEWGLTFPNGPPAHPRCRCAIQYQSTGTL